MTVDPTPVAGTPALKFAADSVRQGVGAGDDSRDRAATRRAKSRT